MRFAQCTNDSDYFLDALEYLFDETNVTIIVNCTPDSEVMPDSRVHSLCLYVLNTGKVPVFGSLNRLNGCIFFHNPLNGIYLYIKVDDLFKSGLTVLY